MRSKGFRRLRVVVNFATGLKEFAVDLPLADGQGLKLLDTTFGIDHDQSTAMPTLTATGIYTYTFGLSKRSQTVTGSVVNLQGLLLTGGFEGFGAAGNSIVNQGGSADSLISGVSGLVNKEEVFNQMYLTTHVLNVTNPSNLVLIVNLGFEVFDLTSSEQLAIFSV